MRYSYIFLGLFLFIISGCIKEKEQSDNDFITIDITDNYPLKELILQDIMDVEYIALETNETFICQGFVQNIGKNIILVRNYNRDGDIFIFNRKGKALKKINHLGQGGEEYTFILGITLDEDNNKMFINDNLSRKILVYDLEGNFKRSFKHKEGTMYDKIYNFDQDNLLCHDGYSSNNGEANEQSFMLISKSNGNITKEIRIPFNKKILTAVLLQDPKNGMTYGATPSSDYPIIPIHNNWILIEPSSDTLFTFSSDLQLKPFIIRKPSIESMNPETFLFISSVTDRYCFMEIVEKKYDFGLQKGFPRTNIVYDKQDNSLFKCIVYNKDFSDKKQVYMNSIPVNCDILTWQSLNTEQLIESYNKGKLKGKLKEIAANLEEDSNPVIMLLKHKK